MSKVVSVVFLTRAAHMRPINAYDEPLRATACDEDVVLLGIVGKSHISFSMTRRAARQTFHNLAHALLAGLHPSASDSRIVVLLVEDDPMVREIGAALLEDAGYAVIATDGPKAALLALESGDEIDLLFTDIHMPGDLDGLQLARMVKDRWPTVRLLVTSGRPSQSLEALPPGGRFVSKPYAAADILRHLDELMAV